MGLVLMGIMACMCKIFKLFQRLGIHITPNHYYYPIPDTRILDDDLWSRNSELIGININEEENLKLLSLFISKYKDEYNESARAFGSVDGEILYCMIRHFNTRKIIEIGSGSSTYLMAQTILKNMELGKNLSCELISIDPYPNKIIKTGFPGLSKLIPKKVQEVSLSEFKKLKENDILFIDSSHVLKIGSDVQYEYLEILPRLNKGVIVHIHDIFLPAEYPKKWVLNQCRFWTEQYILQAFLTYNDNFEVLWAGSNMHLKYADKLEKAFNSYNKNISLPASFWIRRIK